MRENGAGSTSGGVSKYFVREAQTLMPSLSASDRGKVKGNGKQIMVKAAWKLCFIPIGSLLSRQPSIGFINQVSLGLLLGKRKAYHLQ